MNEYQGYRAAERLSRLLPRPWAYWIGLRMADRFYRTDDPARVAVMRNLRQIFAFSGVYYSDEALAAMARSTFRHFGKYLVDFFRFSSLAPDQLNRLVTLEHAKNLELALEQGKGVLLATAHFGNWELGGAVLSAMGYNFHAVVRPNASARLERLFNYYRNRRGIHTIPVQHAGRDVLARLKKGELVALLADRDFTGSAHRELFFGKPVSVPRGPAWLACKTGAPILPAFLVRQADDSFVLRFREPIIPDTFGNEADVRRQVMLVLEREIAQAPNQWFVFHDYWTPTDGKDLAYAQQT